MADTILEMIELLNDGTPVEATGVVDLPKWAIIEVPEALRALAPTNFRNRGLELGLHRRTLKKTQIETFKFELARVVHMKLANKQSSWEHFAKAVVGDVSKAREVYSPCSTNYSNKELRNLLAMDALFIVALFKYFNGRGFFWEEFEVLAEQFNGMVAVIQRRDFYIIENQVPMYLLQSAIQQLYENDEETQKKIQSDPRFSIEVCVEDELEKVLNEAVLALNPFIYLENTSNIYSRSYNSAGGLHKHLLKTYPVAHLEKSLINCHHLLDCIYTVVCGHSLPFHTDAPVKSNLPLKNIPSASHLEEIGICVIGSIPTVSNIKLSGKGYFKCARLHLPRVELYDYIELAFHNLALHEQQMFGNSCGDFRCYLQCMASLCVNQADVQLLTKQGVINNHMGNNLLVGMWDRSMQGVSTPCPSRIWEKCYNRIHQHQNAILKQWRHECWTLFFAKPWKPMSVLAGILLLFLTAVQAWLTAFPTKGTKLKG